MTLAPKYFYHLKKNLGVIDTTVHMKEKTRKCNEPVYLSMKRGYFDSWINYLMVVRYHSEAAAMEHS